MQHGGIVLPKDKSPMRIIAIVLYSIAIVADIGRFIFQMTSGTFALYELAVLIFDTFFGLALLFGLFKRNYSLIDLMLVILKVYDGTFFILNSLMKIDNGHINTLDFTSNMFLVAAGVVSLITFIFFCFHYYYEENKYWKWIESSVMLTAILLFVAAVLTIVSYVNNQVNWFYVAEILAMCMQTFAIYFVCKYVEKYV